MSMNDRACRPALHRYRSVRVTRHISMVLGSWLLLLPQLMFLAAAQAQCEELGTTVPPIMEEEEVHEWALSVGKTTSVLAACNDMGTLPTPHGEDPVLRILLGEVPHPPPWG